MPSLMEREFYDEALVLDRAQWEGCLFDGCVLTLTTMEQLRLAGCRFVDCHFVGETWITVFSVPGAFRCEPRGPAPDEFSE